MAIRRGKSAWSGMLLLLAVACVAETGDISTSSTASITVNESIDRPPSTLANALSEPVVTSAASPESSTTLAPAPSTTGASAVTTSTPTVTATTLPLATTAAPPTTQAPTTTVTTLPDDLTVVEVLVREGRVISEDRVDVPLGNRISMRFDSDTRLLVHIHGYDEEFSVAADMLTVYEFQGDLPGIFEVEDHVTHRLLIELKVSP